MIRCTARFLMLALALAPLSAWMPTCLGADEYKHGPDSMEQPDVPRGEVQEFSWTSQIFPGTVRDCWIYVPKQYDPQKPACVMVFQDGGGPGIVRKTDGNLTAGERYYPLRVRPKEIIAAEGVAVDAGGLVYATSKEGVQVFDPTGRLCGVLLRPDRGVLQAVTFAGPARDQLVLACGNRLFVRKLLMKGIK